MSADAPKKAVITDDLGDLLEGFSEFAEPGESFCERAERRFARGDKGALLDVVVFCAMCRTLLPEWARDAFVRAYNETKLRAPRHSSWDKVFGRPHPKGKKLSAQLREDSLRWPVYVAIVDLRAQKPRKDHFQDVADRFQISVALCKKYFLSADKIARMDGNAAEFVMSMVRLEARLSELVGYELFK